MLIKSFDGADLSDADLDGLYAMRAAARAVDLPGEPLPTYDAVVNELRHPKVADGECSHWAAVVDDRITGFLKLARPANSSMIAAVEITVHPEARRLGIATELMRFVLPHIRACGRPIVSAIVARPDDAGAAWIGRLRFRETRRTIMQALMAQKVDPMLWDAPVAGGYRLEEWINSAPEELLESYAAARLAIRDAPSGDSSHGFSVWTPESIREAERKRAEAGTEEWVTAAVEEATGRVVGVSMVLSYAGRREVAYVNDTSVLAECRGHGLGRAMKGSRMRWILEQRPDVERVLTTTDSANRYMIAVNHSLGYQDARTVVWAEATADELEATLAGMPGPAV